MKKTLIIFFTLLFSFTSFSVFAKEYVMKCNDPFFNGVFNTWKLVDTPFNKRLFLRHKGDWKESCTGKHNVLQHNGDGAVCVTKVKEEKDRCGHGTFGGCLKDETNVYDFFLYTHSYDFIDAKGTAWQGTVNCKKVE